MEQKKFNNIADICSVLIVLIVFGSLIRFIFVMTDNASKYAAEQEAHRQSVLKVCSETCTPYIVELCYFGDKNNIFIACANDVKTLITKPLKND